MSIRPKPVISSVLLLLAIPAVLLFGLNLYLQTQGIQQQIRSSLAAVLGTPVAIGRLSVTPLGRLKLEGLSSASEGGISLFTADSAIILPDYLRLLKGEFSIRRLLLEHPVIQASLATTPFLISPSLPIQNQLQVSTSQGIPGNVTPSTSLPASTNSRISPKPATTLPGITKTLPHLTITNGEFTLLNYQNLPLFSFHEISLQGGNTPEGGWTGLLQMSGVAIGTGLFLHDLRAPITLSPNATTLSLDDLTAVMGGGKLEGTFSINLPPSEPGYKATLSLSGATLNHFLDDASFGSSSAQGNITGNLQLSGIAGSGSSMEGNGLLECRDAVIQPADFLRQIGQILQIDELQLLQLSEAKCLFSIHSGTAVVDDLTLHSENLILDAKGPVDANGNLDLQARLLFNEKITSRIGGFLGSQLTQAPEQGYSQVAFHLSGPPQNPRTDLLDRLTGIHLGGGLGGLLQGLFGAPRPNSHP